MSATQRERYVLHEQRVKALVAQGQRHPLSDAQREELQREILTMRMVCDTLFMLDETSGRDAPKLDEIGWLLESVLASPGVTILVFSEWERMLLLVRERCEVLSLSCAWHTGSLTPQQRRQEIMRFRNDPACRVMLATDTGAHLPQADVVINCDLPWSSAIFKQRVSRARHRDAARSLMVINVIAAESIESRIQEHLPQSGRDSMSGLVSARQKPGYPRRPFMQQVTALTAPPPVAPRHGRPEAARPSQEALRALDPELGFAAALANRIGDRLQRCEVWVTKTKGTGFLIAMDGDVRGHETEIRQLCRDWLGEGGRQAMIEILSTATDAVIRRLLAGGVLCHATETRILYRSDQGLARPRLAPDSLAAHVQERRHQAEACYREACRLMKRLAFDDAVQPLHQAILWLARAYAVQHRLVEPDHVADALADTYAPLWDDLLPVLRREIADNGSAVSLARALMAKFGA